MAATLPPKERGQHDAVIVEDIWEAEQRMRPRARVRHASQLDKLRNRKRTDGSPVLLSDQYITGVRVADLFERAGVRPKTIMRYSTFIAGGQHKDMTGMRLDAYRAWQRAMAIIDGFAEDVVFDVVCMDRPVNGEKNMEVLRRALICLGKREWQWWEGREDAA